jgi:hypothetical protein
MKQVYILLAISATSMTFFGVLFFARFQVSIPPDEKVVVGQVSEELLRHAPADQVTTQDEIQEYYGREIAIFPPDLSFENTQKVPPENKMAIAKAQRRELLKNTIQGLDAKAEAEARSKLEDGFPLATWALDKIFLILAAISGMVTNAMVRRLVDNWWDRKFKKNA